MSIHYSLLSLKDKTELSLKSQSKDGKDGKDGKDDACINAKLPWQEHFL